MSTIRRGFTIVELAVVLGILGLVGSAVGMTLLRQQRFYRGASELLYAREGVRDALDVLSTDIRGSATSDTIRLATDSAIELFANIGSSVVCDRSSPTAVGLPPAWSAGVALTGLITQPDTGDLALFYASASENGEHWERHRIAGFTARPLAITCPEKGFFGESAGGGASADGFLLALATPLSEHVSRGAPVRFIRRERYSLYRASDAEWYLGYRRCNALGTSECGVIQPVSGPYRQYSPDGRATGLLFEYFNAQGAQLAVGSDPLAVARINITARAQSREHIAIEGHSWTPGDSAMVSVAIRNRRP